MNKFLTIAIILLFNTVQAQKLLIDKADSLYVNGNYSKAINEYSKVKNLSSVYHKIAKSYIAIGNYDKALNNYKLSIEANPEDALLKYEYAKLLSKTKKYEEASNVFYSLIDMDYKNPNYHYELGLVLEHLKDSTAQNRFHSAYMLDRTHQKAIFRMARFHVKKRHYKTANYYIDEGLSSYANNKELISLKAQNYYWKKDYDNAVVWFEKLLELNESSQFIHEKLSYSYSKIYKYQEAIEQCKKALKFDPKNANNLYILAQLYDYEEDHANAEKYYRASLLLQDIPLDTEYQKLGMVLNKQKKHKEALEAYKKAVYENPTSPDANFFLVLTKDQYYEDIDTRIQLYEKFVKNFPESVFTPMAERRISQLKEEKFLKTD